MTTKHKPDPEFVEYLKNQVKNPFLSAATVMQMERVFIDQREKYEAKLQAAREQEGVEAVATLNEAQCFSWEDARRVAQLPPGTKLYTLPPAVTDFASLIPNILELAGENDPHGCGLDEDEFVERLKKLAAESPICVGTKTMPEGWRSQIEKALSLAKVFDDGSDGADGESAASVVSILAALLSTPAESQADDWVNDVVAERKRQDEKWGGPVHDDQKSPNDFVQHIEDYAGWARVMAGMGSLDKYRRRMVQVAALAGAAIEASDRSLKRPQPREREE